MTGKWLWKGAIVMIGLAVLIFAEPSSRTRAEPRQSAESRTSKLPYDPKWLQTPGHLGIEGTTPDAFWNQLQRGPRK